MKQLVSSHVFCPSEQSIHLLLFKPLNNDQLFSQHIYITSISRKRYNSFIIQHIDNKTKTRYIPLITKVWVIPLALVASSMILCGLLNIKPGCAVQISQFDEIALGRRSALYPSWSPPPAFLFCLCISLPRFPQLWLNRLCLLSRTVAVNQ